MESNIVNVKPEPLFGAINKLHVGSLIPVTNSYGSDCSISQTESDFLGDASLNYAGVGCSFGKPMKVDSTNSNHSVYLSTQNSYLSDVDSKRDLNYSISCENSFSGINSLNNVFLSPNRTMDSAPKLPPSSNLKPSEALFVRTLIGKCKRIAPLWFRGVSSMRERNREENRRMACNNGQSQNDWSLIALKIAEMNSVTETDAVSNLLKKLYKELPTDSVFWFIKCWLGSEDTVKSLDTCIISRGDAKGRMRRIDGGKGSDKVWRLDTIVGMLYHGLPMSSTDTNIMVHTCDQELCVRPQHIRFRASSVALVVVLKALSQAGFTILPPPVEAGPNGIAANALDESVDVFGPFTIKELQQYRSENLNPAAESITKLSLSATDREIMNSDPVFKEALRKLDGGLYLGSVSNGLGSFGSQVMNSLVVSNLANQSQPHPSSDHNLADNHDSSSSDSDRNSPSRCPNYNHPHSTSTASKPNTSAFKPPRYSLKRPAPTDSPCSFPSSPAKLNAHQMTNTNNQYPHLSTSPPMLITDVPSLVVQPTHHNVQLRRPSDSTLNFKCDGQNMIYSTPLNVPVEQPSVNSSFVNQSAVLPQQSHSIQPQLLHSHHQFHPQLHSHQHHHSIDSDQSMFYTNQHESCSVVGVDKSGENFGMMGNSVAHPPLIIPTTSNASGKTTPRQPAKKRLEARTPTIECSCDDGGNVILSSTSANTTMASNSDKNDADIVINPSSVTAQSAFKVHQNTPFVPVMSKLGHNSNSSNEESLNLPSCNGSLVSKVTSTDINGKPSDDTEEEAEMDQELVDIMIGRMNQHQHLPTAAAAAAIHHFHHNNHYLHHPHHSSFNANINGYAGGKKVNGNGGANAFVQGHHHSSDSSPNDKQQRIVVPGTMVSNGGSPGIEDSFPILCRSSSVYSLPNLDSNTADTFVDYLTDQTSNKLQPFGNVNNSDIGCANGDLVKTHDHYPKTDVTPPPPSLTEEKPTYFRDSLVITPNDSKMSCATPDSMHDLATLFRYSPASGITQDLIDMLANMAQQYGVQQPRAGSTASRPSSQIAQHFYRSLVNGSMCGSPFLLSNSLCGNLTPNTSSTSNENAFTNGSNATPSSLASNDFHTNLFQSPSCCTTSNVSSNPTSSAATALSIHHLRSLSFTPLSVDPDCCLISSANCETTKFNPTEPLGICGSVVEPNKKHANADSFATTVNNSRFIAASKY